MSQTPLEAPTVSADADDPDVRRQLHATAWARFRPLIMRLHFYAGMFIAPFILIAAVTGLLYALIPQLDTYVYRHELNVDSVGAQRMSLADQLAAVRSAHPEGVVESIRPPTTPEETTWVTLAVDDVPPDYARTVFVDPYTGEVRGALTTFGQWMPMRAWFDEFHRNLHLGVVGRHYSELAASWLWVVALAGLMLWIGHRRGTGKLRRLAAPDRGVKGRRRLLSWHGALGVWIIAGLLLLSVSGMTWSRYAGSSIDILQSHLSWKTPALDTALSETAPAAEPAQDSGHHGEEEAEAPPLDDAQALRGADIALRSAQDAGLHTPIWMYPPAAAGEGWHVAENKRDWPTRYDSIAVNPDTGAITDRVNFADWPFMAKMTDWIIGAHMGILFGIVNQALLAATAVALIAMIVLAYRMWWRRRPTRSDKPALPTAPRRGALGELRPYEAVGVVVVLAVLGYFVPLFGLSLALFVAVDVALGWRRARTATKKPQPAR